MTNIEELVLFDEIVAKERALLKSKGSDYATAEDVLQNFKIAAEFAGTTAEMACRIMIGIKIARIQNLWNRPACNESLDDSITDLRNYLFLLQAIRQENHLDTQLHIQSP